MTLAGAFDGTSVLMAIATSWLEPRISEIPCFARFMLTCAFTGSSELRLRLSSSDPMPDEVLLMVRSNLIPASWVNSAMIRSKRKKINYGSLSVRQIVSTYSSILNVN